LENKRFKGQHHKLLPIRYGPYTILQKVVENAYRLDLPPHLGIHNVINVNHLKFFKPPLLEEAVTITHPVNNIPYFQLPLTTDTLLDTRTRSTRNKAYTSYLVVRPNSSSEHVDDSCSSTNHVSSPPHGSKGASRHKQGGIGLSGPPTGQPPRALNSTKEPGGPPRGTNTWGAQFNN